MTGLHFLLIGLGGFLGAVGRYYIGEKYQQETGLGKATIFVNLLGSFLIGLVMGIPLHPTLKIFLTLGFLGAFTTYATVQKEWMNLWKEGYKKEGILYLAWTYAGGILLATIGYLITKLF